MKKVAVLVTVLVTLSLFVLVPQGAGVEEWDSWRDSLPSGVRDSLPEGEPERAVGLEALLDALVEAAKGEMGHFLKTLLSLLGITILGGVATLLAEESGEALQNGIRLTVTVCAALAIHQAVVGSLENVNLYLQDVLTFADGLSPVIVGILVSGGASQAAAAAGSNMAGLLLLMQHLCIEVLPPLAGACFGFSLIGALPCGVKTQGIAQSLRGMYLTLLGVICTVSAASLRLQTVIASARDSVAMQTARFAVGNMIPLAGNAIGATLGTLQSSLTLIKNTVGGTAILALALLAIPILVELWGTRLALNLSAAVAQLMGYTAGERLLNDLRGVLDLLLAVAALVSVTMVLYLAVFLRLTLVGGGA